MSPYHSSFTSSIIALAISRVRSISCLSGAPVLQSQTHVGAHPVCCRAPAVRPRRRAALLYVSSAGLFAGATAHSRSHLLSTDSPSRLTRHRILLTAGAGFPTRHPAHDGSPFPLSAGIHSLLRDCVKAAHILFSELLPGAATPPGGQLNVAGPDSPPGCLSLSNPRRIRRPRQVIVAALHALTLLRWPACMS